MQTDIASQKLNEAPKLKYDLDITIAVANSRKSKRWKNKQLKWSTFVYRLSKTRRTNETLAEYKSFSKNKQDEIKDVGGFVGGALKEGRRVAENVQWRSVITLDADFASKDFWTSLFFTIGDIACCIYSTHKSTAEKPRLRLVIPLNRTVTPDEYQAIARKIAADIDIEQFDDTTYQPHRLMYFPSTSRDGKFIFHFNDGEFLNADEYLNSYPEGNWQDISFWPESSRVHSDIKKAVKKQEDPLAKKGIIGAFCRTYTIQEAITKFLSDIYEPCGTNDRYTYIEGSTSAGVIVYEEKYAYSHHATDPISGKLVNAFDLVRLHKFRQLDEEAIEATPTSRLPSYKAMQDLALEDKAVKKTIGKEKLAEAKSEFSVIDDTEIDNPEKTDWLTNLKLNRWGKYENVPHNVKLILEHDVNLKLNFRLNTFSHRISVVGPLPWRVDKQDLSDWSDTDDSGLRNYLSDVYDIKGADIIKDSRNEIMAKNAFNPVRDYLNALKWDGIKRVNTFFIDYLGAEDTELNQAMTRKMFAAGVARILKPGCKWDYVLTLVGGQGQGKSFIVGKLGKKWSSESMSTVLGKEAMEQIQGFWIIELAELAAVRKAEAEQIKHFISKREDSFRPSYGHHTERYPRQCVFIATTNNPDFIRDQTGGRRWWPITVDASKRRLNPFEMSEATVDQIWAEAKIIYEQGEKLYLESKMEIAAKQLQEAHTEESPMAGMIREFIEKEIPENWADLSINERRDFIRGEGFDNASPLIKRDRVCALEIWVELMEGDIKRLNRAMATEINDVLRKTKGWEKSKNPIRFGHYGRQKGFYKKIASKDLY